MPELVTCCARRGFFLGLEIGRGPHRWLPARGGSSLDDGRGLLWLGNREGFRIKAWPRKNDSVARPCTNRLIHDVSSALGFCL
eukprot:scaffold244_cov172-Amphora_coffeaeformis.AAC.39